jgi:hypothetical protein
LVDGRRVGRVVRIRLRAFCDQMAMILEDERLLRSATQAEVH